MGCWNKTCGITQFPIMAGDKVVTFIIVQGQFGTDSTPSYGNTTWNFIPVPIFGEYNDYGWMDVDKGQNHKLAFLKGYYAEGLVRNPEQADRAKMCYPKLKEPFDSFSSLGDTIHGDVWRIENELNYASSPETRKIASFMIDRRVYDALTASVTRTYPKKKVYTKADVVAALDKYTAHLEASNKDTDKLKNTDISTLSTEELTELTLRLLDNMDFMGRNGYTYVEKEFKGDTYDNPAAGAICFIGDRGGSDRPEIDPGKLLKGEAISTEEVAGVYLLWRAMNVLRKSFFPQSGEGAQSGIEPEHAILTKVMNDMIKFDKTRYD